MALLVSCCFNPDPNPIGLRAWNKIVKHQVVEGNPWQAIETHKKMVEAGFNGDNFTFPILLKAASCLSSPHVGFMLHAQTLKTGFWMHSFVQTSLLNFYSALGDVEGASIVFKEMPERDLVSWNSMLNAYASAGQLDSAADLFELMPVKDRISFNIMISGYANNGMVDCARNLFNEMQGEDVVSWNSMILAHTRAGEMGRAQELFDEMPERNVVSWNTLIGGYSAAGLYDDAIQLFDGMKGGKCEPNHITLTSIISVCACTGSLDVGREIHVYALEAGLTSDPRVLTSLIDMYAKCGSIGNALELFYKSHAKDIYTWNALISGLAFHGNACAALKLFEDMRRTETRPDDLTFVGLLSACSHAGMVEEGCYLFDSMEKKFGVSPKSEHYGCMVDLLGRAGFLNHAYGLIKTMPFEPGASVWGALLSACVVHRDLQIGEVVANHMAESVDDLTDGEYMMLANLYASCGRWDDADRWRQMMNDRGISKSAGCSKIEINGITHKFLAGSASTLLNCPDFSTCA